MTGQRDRGVVLIVLALSLTGLMLFAAFVIDIGAARSARRKAQGTVDGGALAGGRLLLDEDGHLVATPPDAIAQEVIQIVQLNFASDATMSDAGALTLAQWQSRFATCTDPDRDTTVFPMTSTVSACISFNNAMTRVRVRLPDLNVPTYFARVIGMDALRTHADAEVELVPATSAGMLPFGLPSGNAGDAEICLKGNSQPTLPPCDGLEEGNFGNIDVSMYGNPVLGTSSCARGTRRTVWPRTSRSGWTTSSAPT